jgi:hypothetical protein
MAEHQLVRTRPAAAELAGDELQVGATDAGQHSLDEHRAVGLGRFGDLADGR